MVLSELSRLSQEIKNKPENIKITFWDKLKAKLEEPFICAEMFGKDYESNLYRNKIKDFKGYYNSIKNVEIEIIPGYSKNPKESLFFKVLFKYKELRYCRKLGEKQRTIQGFKKLLIKFADIIIDFRDELQNKESKDFKIIRGDSNMAIINDAYCL